MLDSPYSIRDEKIIAEYSTLRDVDLPRLKLLDVEFEEPEFDDGEVVH